MPSPEPLHQGNPEIDYALQGERLGYAHPIIQHGRSLPTDAAEAKFVTAQDPIIQTVEGKRLPAVPVDEAVKLNTYKQLREGGKPLSPSELPAGFREGADGSLHGIRPAQPSDKKSGPKAVHQSQKPDALLRDAIPPTTTNPLFPPVPVYGPPSFLRDLQCHFLRATSAVLSLCFLLVIVLGCLFTGIIPSAFRHLLCLVTGRHPEAHRPFFHEEQQRKRERRASEKKWMEQRHANGTETPCNTEAKSIVDPGAQGWPSLEGGPDLLRRDPGYYARRAGLEMETFDVQTEDGFIIQLWHLFDPREAQPSRPEMRRFKSASVFRKDLVNDARKNGSVFPQYQDGHRRYPVLLMHGLLQSSGAYCCTDDRSLAFYLAKSGYDVWLGNNRCGTNPRHIQLDYTDPRMWAWNIRQMGVLDLAALTSRVLEETGFEKLGLVCHSQGTTQTFVALAKEQRPELGDKLSVFCALAPAAYAGPLIKKAYFKFMRAITPSMFRIIFGIHAFIPLMVWCHGLLPPALFGFLGYHVFSFLFEWTDERWERDLRNRMFQFAPVFVSSESMRWWLGRECFAKQRCILATRKEGIIEDEEDEEEERRLHSKLESIGPANDKIDVNCTKSEHRHGHEHRARYAWYNERAPPFALWVAGNDHLVDGRRLLRRFDKGREPYVHVVHKKIIEGYEHLDVLWAMDAIEKVGREVREVIWRTAPENARRVCRTPMGCEDVQFWKRPSPTTKIDSTVGEWRGHVRDDSDSSVPGTPKM